MTTTADVQGQIGAANGQFMAAFKRHDPAALAAMYTGDGMLLPPNSGPITGTDAIRAFWDGIFDLGIDAVILETLDLTPLGDTAVEVGRATLKGADGTVLDEGKYLVVWRKSGGAWKLHHDMWNSSRPASA